MKSPSDRPPSRDDAGPTGDYPLGKLNAEDKGELKVAVSSEGGQVRIDFGTPVTWVSLPPDAALEFAAAVAGRATAMKRGQ